MIYVTHTVKGWQKERTPSNGRAVAWTGADGQAFMSRLRTHRDRAMVLAMLRGGLRSAEVRGLLLKDVDQGRRRSESIWPFVGMPAGPELGPQDPSPAPQRPNESVEVPRQ